MLFTNNSSKPIVVILVSDGSHSACIKDPIHPGPWIFHNMEAAVATASLLELVGPPEATFKIKRLLPNETVEFLGKISQPKISEMTGGFENTTDDEVFIIIRQTDSGESLFQSPPHSKRFEAQSQADFLASVADGEAHYSVISVLPGETWVPN